jgi:hypothetical protein
MGVAPDVFAVSVVSQILSGVEEVTYNSEDTLRGNRESWDRQTEMLNDAFGREVKIEERH